MGDVDELPEMEPRRTATIRSDVNLKKKTLRLVSDPQSPGRYSIAFALDATSPCKVTVCYQASEQIDDDGLPTILEAVSGAGGPPVHFTMGLGQLFQQAVEYGLDVASIPPEQLDESRRGWLAFQSVPCRYLH